MSSGSYSSVPSSSSGPIPTDPRDHLAQIIRGSIGERIHPTCLRRFRHLLLSGQNSKDQRIAMGAWSAGAAIGLIIGVCAAMAAGLALWGWLRYFWPSSNTPVAPHNIASVGPLRRFPWRLRWSRSNGSASAASAALQPLRLNRLSRFNGILSATVTANDDSAPV